MLTNFKIFSVKEYNFHELFKKFIVFSRDEKMMTNLKNQLGSYEWIFNSKKANDRNGIRPSLS